MTFVRIVVFFLMPALSVWLFAFWFVPFCVRAYRAAKLPPVAPVESERRCVCGHLAEDHSPCSPMGYTKCDCWRTSVWIN